MASSDQWTEAWNAASWEWPAVVAPRMEIRAGSEAAVPLPSGEVSCLAAFPIWQRSDYSDTKG
eukprot:5851183-Amphidinium_carterae.1